MHFRTAVFVAAAAVACLTPLGSFGLSPEKQKLLEQLQEEAAAESRASRSTAPSIVSKGSHITLKGKDVTFDVSGLAEPVAISELAAGVGRIETTQQEAAAKLVEMQSTVAASIDTLSKTQADSDTLVDNRFQQGQCHHKCTVIGSWSRPTEWCFSAMLYTNPTGGS